MAMEAIFILSELATLESVECLSELAMDQELDSEARCAAVWGLGIAGANEPARVIPFIADDDEDVALHALAGVGRIAPSDLPAVVDLLDGSDRQAASAAVVLSEQGDDGVASLLGAARSGSAWAIGELGRLPEPVVRRVARDNLSDDLARVLDPLWRHATVGLRTSKWIRPSVFSNAKPFGTSPLPHLSIDRARRMALTNFESSMRKP